MRMRPGVLDRLRPRWERLGAPYELNIQFEVPGVVDTGAAGDNQHRN